MANVLKHYNHTTKLFLGQQVDLSNVKVMLLNDDMAALFDPADTDISDVDAAEVFGNGWAEGGEVLADLAAITVMTNDALLTATNISKTPTDGDIGPAPSAVFYDATSGKLLSFNDFGETKQAGVGTLFKMNFPNGIIPMSYTPA